MTPKNICQICQGEGYVDELKCKCDNGIVKVAKLSAFDKLMFSELKSSEGVDLKTLITEIENKDNEDEHEDPPCGEITELDV